MSMFGGADSEVKQNQNSADGADAAANYGGGASATGNALAIGTKGTYTSPGGYNLAGVKINKGGTLTIQQSDPNIALAITKLSEQSAAGTEAASANYAQISESNAGLFDKIFGKLGELSESKQTDGKSGENKTVLYVIIAIVFGFVVWGWRKMK